MSNNFLPPVFDSGLRAIWNKLVTRSAQHPFQDASPPPAGFIDALAGIQLRYFPIGQPAHLSELIDDFITLTKTHLNPWDIRLDSGTIKAKVTNASFWEVLELSTRATHRHTDARAGAPRNQVSLVIYRRSQNTYPDARFVYLVRDGRDVRIVIASRTSPHIPRLFCRRILGFVSKILSECPRRPGP
jgi:hypothetical protein